MAEHVRCLGVEKDIFEPVRPDVPGEQDRGRQERYRRGKFRGNEHVTFLRQVLQGRDRVARHLQQALYVLRLACGHD